MSGRGEEIDELALEAVRVLELVDHDRAEAQLLAVADRLVVAEEVARASWRSSKSSADSRSFAAAYASGELVQELLQQVAVLRATLVERGLLDGLAGLLVRGGALAARARSPRGRAGAPARGALEQLERGAAGAARCVGRAGVVGEAARRLAQLLDALREAGPLAELELELAARGAQRLVDRVSIRRRPAAP